VRRMLSHWDTLLEGVIDNPVRPISELPLLTAVDEHRQLVEWNATETDYPRDSCVHHLVTAQAARTPDAIAVTDSRGAVSFAELDEQAGRLAAHLCERGVGPDTIVGVCMERSVDMVVALLAALKAGGAYMPLEPDHPRERLATMIGDARPAVILTTGGLRERLPTSSASVVQVDTERPSWMRHDPVERGEARPANLAYVLYTSGSTGQPKGVMIEHRSIVNQLVWRTDSFRLGAADRVLQKTPLGFDVSLWELFCPLISGASLVLLEPAAQGDPVRIMAAIRTHGITALHFVPSLLQEFLSADVRGCDSLRLVASSGEALSAHLAHRFFECFGPEVELRNLYGPTEAAVDVTSWRCESGGEEFVPIGRPVANTKIYLLGDGDRVVPVGVPGELCIGGVQVARGYLNQPELTAKHFVANPFQTGERIYRTGDRARYRDDGTIEHLGRLDHQLKIRGFRIEPGEIETALLACEGIASAVVVAREDTPGDARLVGYIVPNGEAPTSARLRELLRRTLPDHMVPAAFVTLDVLPLTHSGKVDRTALPHPQWYQTSTADRAARSPIEKQLATIWARILRVDRVGVEDDFFDVGGHSLLAVRLLVEVKREFGVDVPLAAFFEQRATVAGLAAAIEATREAQLSDQPAIEAHAQATTPILFFIHADESSMLTLRHFIGPLGSGHRVVGLLPERVGRRFDRSRSIEELAAPMLETIRQAQPHGPYFLAGYSLGGVLVYELAGRLEAAGEHVGWLGVLDSATPAAAARYQRQRLSLRQRVGRQRARGVRGAARKTYEVLRRELTAAVVRLRLRRSEMSDEFDWRGAKALLDRYACHPNNVAMDLFVTADRAAGAGSDSLGWTELHGGVLRVHRVEGDHRAIVTEPQVAVVADMVGHSLREAVSACRAS
jgi:amino acid adenylation domain-containing protein